MVNHCWPVLPGYSHTGLTTIPAFAERVPFPVVTGIAVDEESLIDVPGPAPDAATGTAEEIGIEGLSHGSSLCLDLSGSNPSG